MSKVIKRKIRLNNKLTPALTCGIIILIIFLEIIGRMIPIDITPPIQPSKLSNIAWEFVPNSTGKTWGNPVKINSFSLRDYEFNKGKKQNTFRILVIGSSFTYGVGLPLEKTYTKILESNLNKNAISKYYQVINAGFPEYSLSHLTAYLKHEANQLQPNLILISLEPETFISEFISPCCLKELRMNAPLRRMLVILKQKSYFVSFLYNCFDNLCKQNEITSFKYAAQLRYPAEPTSLSYKDTADSLMRKELTCPIIPIIPVIPIIPGTSTKDHLYLPRKSTTPFPITTTKIMQVKNDGYIKPKSPVPGDYNYSLLQFLCDTKRPYWSIYKNNFEEIEKFCQKINIPVLLIIWPQPYEHGEDVSYAYLSAQINSLAKSNAIITLGLLNFLKDDEKKFWIRRNNNSYPNINLHRLAAEELYKLLGRLYALD